MHLERARNSESHYSHLEFSHGDGARCWTTDGREYIDLICGHGAVLLGHAHPDVTAAVCRQLGRGSLLPGPGPVWAQLRARLFALYPHHEDALTFKTGSEAVAAAIRLSRAHTGREAVIRVGFHGWHDQVASPLLRCHSYDAARFQRSWPPGIPHRALADTMVVWSEADPDDLLALIRSRADRLAAVIVDPVQLRPPAAISLAARLREAVTDAGAVLIFDESKTGFRVHLGGVQALYSMTADLTILGKALANGHPLAVVLGPRVLTDLADSARIKGTYSRETSAMAAAVATIDILQAVNAPAALSERGTHLLHGLTSAIDSAGLASHVSAVPYHWACMPYINFAPGSDHLRRRFHELLIDRGVLMLDEHMSYVSLALTDVDTASVVIAVSEALGALRRSGP